MTVRENIGFGLEVKGIAAAEPSAKVDRILDMFDLAAYADRKGRPPVGRPAPADRIGARSGGRARSPAAGRTAWRAGREPGIIQNELSFWRELGITFIFVTPPGPGAGPVRPRCGHVEQRGRADLAPASCIAAPADAFRCRLHRLEHGDRGAGDGRGRRWLCADRHAAWGHSGRRWRHGNAGRDPGRGRSASRPEHPGEIHLPGTLPAAIWSARSGTCASGWPMRAKSRSRCRPTAPRCRR